MARTQRKRLAHTSLNALWYLAASVIAVAMVGPFLWMVSTALSSPREAMAYPPHFIPSQLYWRNFAEAVSRAPLLRTMANSTFVAVSQITLNLLISSLAAYAFSRLHFPGRDRIFVIYLSAMMIPFQVTLVPVYLEIVSLGWVDNYLAIIIPGSSSVWNIFLLRQFFMTIPGELSDAARNDGSTEFDIYGRVILPLARPALATVGLMVFLGTWNDFMGPLIYLYDDSKFPLSLGLAMFTSQYGSFWGQLMAVSTVMTAPILLLFFLTQRTFIQGITMTGLKG